MQGAWTKPWSHLHAFKERAVNYKVYFFLPTPPQIPYASLCMNILKILSLPLFFPQKEDTKPMASSSAHSKQAVRWLRGRIISRGELGVL